MPSDPVCGVTLTEETSKFKISYGGTKYYFCSVGCKKKFKRNAMKYAK
jgi:YHS domain-containing protein